MAPAMPPALAGAEHAPLDTLTAAIIDVLTPEQMRSALRRQAQLGREYNVSSFRGRLVGMGIIGPSRSSRGKGLCTGADMARAIRGLVLSHFPHKFKFNRHGESIIESQI